MAFLICCLGTLPAPCIFAGLGGFPWTPGLPLSMDVWSDLPHHTKNPDKVWIQLATGQARRWVSCKAEPEGLKSSTDLSPEAKCAG